MRSNALTVIHKYIRRELFAVSRTLASAGPEHGAGVTAALRDVAQLLEGHAALEEAAFKPMLAAGSERLDAEHHRLHAALAAILAVAATLEHQPAQLEQLHLDWQRFVGDYLLHLDEEERTLFVPIADRIPSLADMIAKWTVDGGDPAFLARLFEVLAPAERAQFA